MLLIYILNGLTMVNEPFATKRSRGTKIAKLVCDFYHVIARLQRAHLMVRFNFYFLSKHFWRYDWFSHTRKGAKARKFFTKKEKRFEARIKEQVHQGYKKISVILCFSLPSLAFFKNSPRQYPSSCARLSSTQLTDNKA